MILSAFAIVVGLLVALSAFYLYQRTKQIDTQKIKPISIVSTPTPKPSVFLKIDTPGDEKVFDKKIISVSGKTVSGAIIVILSENSEEVLNPTANGDFTTTITLENGENLIQITAIGPDGQDSTVERTVTYSTESF